jgi:hypothetical protein
MGMNVNLAGSSVEYFDATAANVNDNTVVYESGDVSAYNRHEFAIYQAPGAGAVEVFVSHDGTNYETAAIQVVNRALVVGALVQSLTDLVALGNYYVEGRFKKFKIQNKGATTGAVTKVRGSHSNF